MRQIKRDKTGISDRHRLLVDNYFKLNCDKTNAAVATGYKHGNGYINRLFDHPDVVAEIEKRQREMQVKYELTEEWVIERFMRIADAGAVLARFKKPQLDGSLMWDFTDATPADLVSINELSVDYYTEGRGENTREVKKFKVGTSDPKGALDSLARHLGLFKDKLEISGSISLADRIQRGRDRINADKGKT